MNKYEYCFYSWYGKNGKQKHPSAYYCYEGYDYDSRTNKRINDKCCVDWANRCSLLILNKRGRKVQWEPSVKGNVI